MSQEEIKSYLIKDQYFIHIQILTLELKVKNKRSLYLQATEPPKHPGVFFYEPFPDLFLLLRCTKEKIINY